MINLSINYYDNSGNKARSAPIIDTPSSVTPTPQPPRADAFPTTSTTTTFEAPPPYNAVDINTRFAKQESEVSMPDSPARTASMDPRYSDDGLTGIITP